MGVLGVNMSTIERRYELSSSEVVWIAITFDIVGGVAAVVFGYMGVFAHIGVLLTISAYSLSLGTLIMALPNWLAGTYDAGQEIIELCDVNGKNGYKIRQCM